MSDINLNMSLKELLEKQLEEVELFKAEATCNHWKDDYHMHVTITNDKVFETEEEAEADMREFIINDMYNLNLSDFEIDIYKIVQGNKLLMIRGGD